MIINYMNFFLILFTIKIILGTLESVHFLNVEQNVSKTVLSHIVPVHLYIYEVVNFYNLLSVNSMATFTNL
jgi:hypothetical protein